MIDDFAAIVAKFEEVNEEIEARKVGAILEHIRKGQPLKEVAPELSQGVRFHVLGLAPNAARLSVRYWLTDDFGQFAQRLAEHHADLRMDPPPMGWGAAPSVNRLLARTTAFQGKFENIPPLLAGEVMRAVLSGSRYPQSLLSVFEIEVDPAQWTALKAKLEGIIDPKLDSLRYYYLGANWQRRVEHVGAKAVTDLGGPLIV